MTPVGNVGDLGEFGEDDGLFDVVVALQVYAELKCVAESGAQWRGGKEMVV